jgi:arabinan endo-1,5-alpha-L-arabinosidase
MRSLAVLSCALVAACTAQQSVAPAVPEPVPWWTSGARGPLATGCRHVPYIAGGFYRVFVPRGIRYLNDHTLIRGPDGTWHLFGITNASAGDPAHEHEFLHATAPALFGPWTEQADALVADARYGEQVLWAPYVFRAAPGEWRMFYYADRLTPQNPEMGSREAVSYDLWHWRRSAEAARPATRPRGGRDPFVLRLGRSWLLYSVGVDAWSRGQILLSESRDAAHEKWSRRVAVLTDPVPANPWRRGNVQSPFVFEYDGQYYLFVTRKSLSPIDYARTYVFCSNDPRQFVWRPIADLRAHAAEIVVDGGHTFITSAGWTRSIGELHRGLSIAPLEWATP